MNPFENSFDGNYSDYIKELLEPMQINESKQFPPNGRTIVRIRALISIVSKDLGIKIITRSDKEGNLWIKRLPNVKDTKSST